MTHEDVRRRALVFAREHGYDYRVGRHTGLGLSVIASETVTEADDIPDLIGWKNGQSYLIECKASHSDFLADAKKPQRNNGTGMGNVRYFMAPAGLISANELPEGWGLVEVEGKAAQVTAPATRRELDSHAHECEKRILLSLLRRIKMREFLIIQDERGLEEK